VNRAGIDYSRVPLARIIAEAYQIPYTRITTSDSRLREVLSGTYDIRAEANTLLLGLLAAKASEEV
jgi:hypothetical protein